MASAPSTKVLQTVANRIIDKTDNLPPFEPTLLEADPLLHRFAAEYEPLTREVADLLAAIRADAPTAVEDEHQNGIIAKFMERLRTTTKHAEAKRVGEKAPYLKAERAIDQFFAGLTDRLATAQRILQKRGDEYTARKVALERAERQRLAAEAADKARQERDEADRLAREAAEMEAAANRARKPENIARLEQSAEVVGMESITKQVDAMVAESAAENAHLATMASSADIARTRHASGHLSTAKQVPFIEITDPDALDMKALWPYIKEDVKLSALKAWAKATNHRRPMAGAVIEMRDAASYR